MKNLLLAFLLFYVINAASCAAEKETPQAELVYLSAESTTVSSFDATPDWAPPPNPQATIDGSLLSRWSSDYAQSQWIILDLGRTKILSQIVLFWEAAYAVDYDILVSKDNRRWQTVLSVKGQDGDIDQLQFAPRKARYVKLLGKKRFNAKWGISIWEFLCLGPADRNPGEEPLSLVYPKLAARLGRQGKREVKLELEMPLASPGAVSMEEFQKGIVYTSWGTTELGSEVSDQTLKHLQKIGVRHLGIMIVWYQDTIEEDTIYPDSKDTPDDVALAHAINQAHALGMKVMLKPHVDVQTDQWRGDIIPSRQWFKSYKDYMLCYARLAERYNVELFSIGTELTNITLPKWQAHWEDLIDEIRQVFTGRLVYSANWDEYQTVGFWDRLDFVGIDAYFPLTEKKNPGKEELIAAWETHARQIDSCLKKNKLDKPVVFTEVGYSSADGTNTKPWAVFANLSAESIDQEEQALCLEAMLLACSNYPWFRGFYWWSYFPQKRWSPLGYTIRGKEAEEIMTKWLKKL
jgi:hypothetical protein